MPAWLKFAWPWLFPAEDTKMYAVVEVRTCTKFRPARSFWPTTGIQVRLTSGWKSNTAVAGLRIRIHFIRIRIRIQHFRLNTDPDPGVWWPKVSKKITYGKKLNFSGSKTTIYLSLGLHKGRPSYKRSLHLSKFFSTLWVIFALLNPDPDPLTRLNPDPIRIRICNRGSL